MSELIQKIFTGSIVVILFSVLIVLALGPAYIQVRDWWIIQKQNKKDQEYEQKHGFKPRKKNYTRGHF